MARIGKAGALGPLDDNMEPDEDDDEGAEVRRLLGSSQRIAGWLGGWVTPLDDNIKPTRTTTRARRCAACWVLPLDRRVVGAWMGEAAGRQHATG